MHTFPGSFALVSYVPEPLGPMLDELRQSVPGNMRSPAHITLLPPRALRVPVEIASDQARRILGKFAAFDVELNSVQLFPETSFLYLDVTEGSVALHDAHENLNQGNLADEERFDFLPHLTLGGPIDPRAAHDSCEAAKRAWEDVNVPKRFLMREVVALWSRAGLSDCAQWQRVWSHTLPSVLTGRSAHAAIGQTS